MTTRSSLKPAWPGWAAPGIWLLVFLVINADVVRHPLKHTTMPTYRAACTLWWAGQDPYTTNEHAGFLYFPQAAFFFTPFNLLPFLGGEILWRMASFGLFAWALLRLNEVFVSPRDGSGEKNFLILSLLAVPSAFASLRNAQFDLPVAAMLVLVAAETGCARWTAATFWLCLAVALKPLAVVPLLLFGALYGKLVPRLAIGLLIVIALPFLHWSPSFVAHEYARCFQTLFWASKGDEPRYSDLAALLSHLGYETPDLLKTIVRVLLAPVYLAIGFSAVRRLSLNQSGWAVGALAADYLMLFNPRTETCSYVFLGPFVASLALFYAQQVGRRWLAYALGLAAVGCACDAFPAIYTVSIHNLSDRWLKPLLALFFLPFVLRFVFENRPEPSVPPESP